MPDDCPCTPMTKFVAETEGRFNVIEERFHRHADRVKDLAGDMTASATQMKEGVAAITSMQTVIEKQNLLLKQGQKKFEVIEKIHRENNTSVRAWLRKLTYGAAAVVAFILVLHGDDALALIKLLL